MDKGAHRWQADNFWKTKQLDLNHDFSTQCPHLSLNNFLHSPRRPPLHPLLCTYRPVVPDATSSPELYQLPRSGAERVQRGSDRSSISDPVHHRWLLPGLLRDSIPFVLSSVRRLSSPAEHGCVSHLCYCTASGFSTSSVLLTLNSLLRS